MSSALLQAKYDAIHGLRGSLALHNSDGVIVTELTSERWETTGTGALARVVPLPFDEDFSLAVGCWEAGQEAHDFDVPHTLEAFVLRGVFDLKLGDGHWIEMRQGSTYILAPGQCHSLRCRERAYLVATMCPPLPVALPPVEHCANG